MQLALAVIAAAAVIVALGLVLERRYRFAIPGMAVCAGGWSAWLVLLFPFLNPS